ncbi:ATP-binding cassette domain-containing protein [Actinocatenispora rupis]|uniref:ABC transporter ATP-binding protein n=1 Tax=Actinocatenispora rupis TaxID=519421 RepID=A0A8J3J5Y6_9ACTN|nr:ATP-binding cassette domain-containing protein [Actinocatenispora rupis]GID12211.1 ABC transporter ATP-binding protein [Actinocatenispora rupis]
MTGPLLDIRDLRVRFPGRVRGRRTVVTAVDGVSLSVDEGETLGLVGESGSGKSTIGNAVLGLVRPTSGSVWFRGENISRLPPGRRRELGRVIQVVFQDPYSSLNPSRTIGQTLGEPLRHAHRLPRRVADARVRDMLRQVGLPADAVGRYPAEFSGGQRQRIAIARAFVLEPRLVVCDEPTSALDLSVQAQILNLLLDLQREHGMSYLFISHDIDVVRHMSHRIAVLLGGRLVEQGRAATVTRTPRHPYTRSLLGAVLPVVDPGDPTVANPETVRTTLPPPAPGTVADAAWGSG